MSCAFDEHDFKFGCSSRKGRGRYGINTAPLADHRYKFVDPSTIQQRTMAGQEKGLNDAARGGWRYIGPMGSVWVFEQ
jgi:hypothetical protein